MKDYFSMRSIVNKSIPWLWAAVWFTLPVSFKANGVSLIIFGLAAVAYSFYYRPVLNRRQVVMACLFLLFFVWHAASLFFDPDTYAVWKSLERKLSLVLIPLIMILVSGSSVDIEKWAIRGFFGGLIITGIHMISIAFFKMISGNPVATYTYHEFTGPYTLGAIYYSFYLTAAIYYLAFREPESFISRFKIPLGIFFLLLLMFCASKLLIVLSIPAILWPLIKWFIDNRSIKRVAVLVLVLLVFIAGSVPFISRVKELRNTDFSVVTQEKFQYDTPLNGLTFRMILWRFAGEIMNDDNAWMSGTGIGSRQDVLNEYYKNYGLYLGDTDLGDTGYLNYNFHSEYLEVLVGTGIPGLIILLLIIIFIFFTDKNELFFPTAVYLIIILFFITESVLERQAGIVFFCLVWTMRVHKPQKIE